MGKVLWHVTMSLDGFIAGPKDDMSWIGDHGGPNETVNEALAQIGALLIGSNTYQLAKTEEGTPYGGAWSGPMFVLTHTDATRAAPGFEFIDAPIEAAVATAKAAAGDRYVVVFGAETAHECLDAGLLDELLVHVAPVLLGDGVRLFEQPGGATVRLERIGLTSTSQVTDLWLRVVR
jgi:dihydrofolate reductase